VYVVQSANLRFFLGCKEERILPAAPSNLLLKFTLFYLKKKKKNYQGRLPLFVSATACMQMMQLLDSDYTARSSIVLELNIDKHHSSSHPKSTGNPIKGAFP
jgi:hypothetical protein